MLDFLNKGDIIIQGDLNACTGELQEFIINDDNRYLDLPDDYEIDPDESKRHSQDKDTVNVRGKSLLESCTALNLRIFNGRVIGDLEGKKTCFRYNVV